MIYAAERLRELANDPEISDPEIRRIPTEIPRAGIGVVEAPRGTLIHHYETDQRGVIRKANLMVATQHNSARIALSVDKAARSFIRRGRIDDGMLNMVEMAFRAYDPCHACGTHSLPGSMPFMIYVYNEHGKLTETVRRNLP
jgi:F420-non-reducing hydrogenase large subunit